MGKGYDRTKMLRELREHGLILCLLKEAFAGVVLFQ